ncbi:MAG: dihydrodipicolinate synthase family protein, partial [archaeon]
MLGKKQVSLKGLVVPLLTPLDENLSLDKVALKNHSARLLNRGVKNLFVLGPYSEYEYLPHNQQREALKVVSATVANHGKVIAGCFGETNDEVIGKVAQNQKIADVCAVNVPPLALESEVFFVEFFDELFMQTKADIVIYNNPFLFTRNVPVRAVNLIEGWERLLAFIDGSRNKDYFNALSTKATSLKIFQESEDAVIDSLQSGCVGIMPLSSNVYPVYFLS